MRIAIGLPNTIPGTRGADILEWARKAEAGPFSSLGTLDRLVYPNYEALITLAAVAGVTQRIRLMTTVLLAPLRNPGILAKQTASIDALSNGRLTLGLGVGGREDDFTVADEPFHTRGKRFEQQLDMMRRTWAGEPPLDGLSSMGPKPVGQGGRPEVLIGGYTPPALKRVTQWDGYIAGGGGPDGAANIFNTVRQAWQEAGREGTPRLVGASYFGLDPNGKERAGSYLRDYYGFLGPMSEQIAAGVLDTPEAVKDIAQRFEAIGADEVVLWPCIPDLDQVDRLAEAIS